MGYRNIILIGALVLGIAIMVMMYVRQGFVDLQGQIDDIETVLASMPPALTSGAWAGAAGGGIGAPTSTPSAPQPSEPPTEYYNLDTDAEDDDALAGYGEEPDDEEERVETLIETDMPEFDLTGAEVTGIATLSEPGYYEAGGVQLEVTPIGSSEDVEYDADFEVSELEPLAGVQEGEGVEGAAEDGADEIAEDGAEDVEGAEGVEAAEPTDDSAEELPEEESSPEVDEFAQLTLPELKARLKVLQPETKGLARLKRAEVLDRLRSSAIVETDSDK